MNYVTVVFISLICATNIISALVTIPTEETVVRKKNFCEYGRVYEMDGYDCSNMNMKEVPQNIRSNVQVFDLSYNRIRTLTRKSFARYSDIVLLYLFDNSIQSIADGTFEHLTNLKAVDLSINALSTIPLELFSLPRLNNLYYSDNILKRLPRDLEKLEKPIVAPLQKIELTKCGLSSIPDFGILPELWILNISNNEFDEITPQQFSPYCNLTTVIIANSTDLSPCMCKTLKKYFHQRNIAIIDIFDCPQTQAENVYCTASSNATVDTAEFETCLVRVEEKRLTEKSKKTWKWILISLGIFFLTFICMKSLKR